MHKNVKDTWTLSNLDIFGNLLKSIKCWEILENQKMLESDPTWYGELDEFWLLSLNFFFRSKNPILSR